MFRPEGPDAAERWERIRDAAVPPPPAPPTMPMPDDMRSAAESDHAPTAAERARAILAEWARRGGSPVPLACDVCGARETFDATGRSRIVHDQPTHAAAAARAELALYGPPNRVATDEDPASPRPERPRLRRVFGYADDE